MSDETKKQKKVREIAVYVRELLGRTMNPRFEHRMSAEDTWFLRYEFPVEWGAWDTTAVGSVEEANAALALLRALEACEDKPAANSSEVTQSILDWTARVIELARKAQQARVDCVVTDVGYDAAFAEYERARLKRAETFRARYALEAELKTATTAAAILSAAKEEKNA